LLVYKYLPPNRTSVLSDLEVGFTAPALFNDPFEVLPVFDSIMKEAEIEGFVSRELVEYHRGGEIEAILEKEIENARPLIEANRPDLLENDAQGLKEYLREFAEPLLDEFGPKVLGGLLGLTSPGVKENFIKSLFEKMNKWCRVLSLSSDCQNILMWSHYADSHRGFVVGFDSEHPFFDQRQSESDSIRKLKAVKYSLDRPVFSGFGENPDTKEVESFSDLVLQTKSKDWEYEQEWRMVLSSDGEQRAVGEGGQVSLVSIPAELIRRVIIGSKTKNETRALIKDSLESGPMDHVDLYHAELDSRQYRVCVDGI